MPSFPGTEDDLNFTFTVAIILTFLFVIHVAFRLFTPYYICKQHYGNEQKREDFPSPASLPDGADGECTTSILRTLDARKI